VSLIICTFFVLMTMLHTIDYVTEVLADTRIDEMHELSEDSYRAYMQAVKDGLEPAACHLFQW